MTATYRLQLRPEFGFADAEAVVPYLVRLGVSHLYLSPVTEARAGSTHGYDVVDHNRVSDALGGRGGFDRLAAACAEHGLGIVLDWVPNHAGVGPRNWAWQDVLAYGPHSEYASTFDVDWDPLKPGLRGKVLLPFLGAPYGEALDGGDIALAYDDGRFYATYYDDRFALSPATYAALLDAALPAHEREDVYFDLKDLADAYGGVAPGEVEKAEALRLRLLALADRADVAAGLASFEGGALHDLLERQAWRLASWKTAGHEINYRRFFDINGLVALRMEEPEVFWESHRLLGELLAMDAVHGVRVDHVDGMFDPAGYLEALRELGAQHVWVEKILGPGETLPDGWCTEGTTGYEVMNDLAHLGLDADGLAVLDRVWRRAVPDAEPWDETVYESKRIVMDTSLPGELVRLATGLNRISELDYRTRDFTLGGLREALVEVVAAFDRYRTYLPHDAAEARAVAGGAVARAKARNPAAEPSVYDFVERAVSGEAAEAAPPPLAERLWAWVGRFQQYTAPVAAKGVEDTAFYRYARLLALNEVGGEPDEGALPARDFHARNRERAGHFPLNLLATATHDHKRGEDTRARLVALAAVADDWGGAVEALDRATAGLVGARGPSALDRYVVLQTLAALWAPPPSQDAEAYRADLADRLWGYVQKAAREAKLSTSWINPDAAYERDLEAFTRSAVADESVADVLAPLAERLAALGLRHTLTQTVLKLTIPGVPDLYQGTERLDLSLVDPDNRRPVDYAERAATLDRLAPLLDRPAPDDVRDLLHTGEADAKPYVTARLLRLRRDRPALFEGDYRGVEVEGDGWVAFERAGGALAVVVPQTPDRPAPATVRLGGAAWTDALTGARVEAEGGAVSTDALPTSWAVLVRD
ncbi:malto-oligosyltrehalose synthase [Rubrivirga litoralis]|uniref:Malto-oligosyltrehalose synthase n=1 Tax=Rubrivirga litoralis TaxID=3075598 RepID=A0ABU3BVE4_9BACT|nr:malto-oligosyltrehalose synthase [Rubrivirga sp. F394]MDT0633257.1 malto-oligosyltrehalose synthase [Rubrivirga sp. F394]